MDVKVKKLLVPTDFSESSQEALEYAVSLAQVHQAQVIILHVMEPPYYGLDFTLPNSGVPAEVKKQLTAAVNQSVEKMKKLGIDSQSQFVTGLPHEEITKAAKKYEADLIVMGTHGRTGLSHFWIGSTAERVIQRSPCPVLTVKMTTKQQPLLLEKEKEARAILKDLPTVPAATFCHICGRPSKDIICETCKIRVQAEALEGKRRTERKGSPEPGRR